MKVFVFLPNFSNILALVFSFCAFHLLSLKLKIQANTLTLCPNSPEYFLVQESPLSFSLNDGLGHCCHYSGFLH